MCDRSRQPKWITLRVFAIGVSMALAECPRVSAHEGPPFPILMDKPLGGYLVSVWADPDIGEATFYVVVESPSGGLPTEVPGMSMWVEPVSGRLDRMSCEAKRQPLQNQLQFVATPHFDQRDQWKVGFRLTSPTGDAEELTTQVESTPPGFGLWDFVIYLFPFLLLGGMWVLAMIRRSRMQYAEQVSPEAGNKQSRDYRLLAEAKSEHGA